MITILLAAYNGEAYLREQLDSILHQTYTDWVLYISDDASRDATPQIIADYAARCPKQIIPLQFDTPSGSAEANFFRMLTAVSGDYIALCDQDDVWLPHKLETTLHALQALEERHGIHTPILIHSDLKVVDQNLNILNESFFCLPKHFTGTQGTAQLPHSKQRHRLYHDDQPRPASNARLYSRRMHHARLVAGTHRLLLR